MRIPGSSTDGFAPGADDGIRNRDPHLGKVEPFVSLVTVCVLTCAFVSASGTQRPVEEVSETGEGQTRAPDAESIAGTGRRCTPNG